MEKEHKQELDTTNSDNSSRNAQKRMEISELVHSYYRGLEKDSISALALNFDKIPFADVEFVLDSGTKILKDSKRLFSVYLKVAPSVFILSQNDEFSKWISIISETSQLGIFCTEGFLNSSVQIIEKGGFELLEKWSDLGLCLGKHDKKFAIAYFEHSGKVLFLNDIDIFKSLVSYGKKLEQLDPRVCDSYFENLDVVSDLFLPEDFGYFCSLLEKLTEKDWTFAVKVLNESKEVFSSVPLLRKRKVLSSIDLLAGCNVDAAMALFSNVPEAVIIFEENSFDRWTKIALKIAENDSNAAVIFLDESLSVFRFITLEEMEELISNVSEILSSDLEAFQSIIHGICAGSVKIADHVQKKELPYFVDIGIRLAFISPDCTESFFRYAPEAYSILPEDMFKKWLFIGESIARKSAVFGSSFYMNSVSVLRRCSSAHEKIFATLNLLLDKDWLLVAVFIESFPQVIDRIETDTMEKWVSIGMKIHDLDKRMAVDYFSNSPQLMSDLDIDELEEWALHGMLIFGDDLGTGRRYFSLVSKESKDFAAELSGSVALRKVSNILRYYGLGLSGVDFNICSRKDLSLQGEIDGVNPVIAGRTIYLAPKISGYGGFDDNFRIYKLSIMHEVGHVLFSSRSFPLNTCSGLLEKIMETYPGEYAAIAPEMQDGMINVTNIIGMFPNPALAANIFGLLEDARVEYRTMEQYRGLRLELEKLRHEMLMSRQVPVEDLERFMDALLWISVESVPSFELEDKYADILSKARKLMYDKLFRSESSTLDSLEITFDLYRMLDRLSEPLENRDFNVLMNLGYRGVGIDVYYTGETHKDLSVERLVSSFVPETGAVLITENDRSAENEDSAQKDEKGQPTYAIEKNWKILGHQMYDEWDFTINDYRHEWCTAHEIEPVGGTKDYYVDAVERHGSEIELIKRIFSVLKPVDFRKLKQQTDGPEIDIDHFIDSLIEKKCGVNPDDNLYIKWDKQKRDVATLFLLDVSASTGKKLAGEKRSIIQVEKDALIMMIHALESIGDKYAINAFSGHKRRGVEYFTIKSFREEMSDTVARRISILEPMSNTRLGAAIRHSITKLEDVESRTKIIVLLSDGEPYDTCQGEGAYQGRLAEEDTRKAIQELTAKGIHLFCITVDSNPGEYIDRIFSNVGYTIIDDVRMLPETLPLLYKRITT